MLQDYHIHALAHGEYEYTYEWLREFVMAFRNQGIFEIGFSEHDEYLARIDMAVLRQIRHDYADMNVRLGLEVDYIPGREEFIENLSQTFAFDYLIGSVHFIDGWGFDHPDYRGRFAQKDIDQVYQRYFELLLMAIESGLFDIVGHLDLIKVWGHRPRKHSSRYYVEPLLNSIKDRGMIIEINSAGLRKPVGEIYPSAVIIDLIRAKNISVCLGSDAHHPSQAGSDLKVVRELLVKAGFNHIAVLEKRQIKLMPLNIE